VVMTPLAEIRPTEHAVTRFRRRMRQPRATRSDVADVIAAGRFRVDPPDGLDLERKFETFGYIVTDRAVFPIERSGPDLVAVTCLRRRRRTKEERRALRAEREDSAY
jgi:hypothetical protein